MTTSSVPPHGRAPHVMKPSGEDRARSQGLPGMPPQLAAQCNTSTLSEPDQAARPVLVLASPAPIPVEVIVTWLRRKAAMGVPVTVSPLLAQRIAAELAQR
jgi:hypothetical protein